MLVCAHAHVRAPLPPSISASVFSSSLLLCLLWLLFSVLAHSELWMVNTEGRQPATEEATRKGALGHGEFFCCDLSLASSLQARPFPKH